MDFISSKIGKRYYFVLIAITLMLVFYQLLQIIITPLTGILIDRSSCKQIINCNDAGSGFYIISTTLASV